MFFLLIITFLC